MKMFLQSRKLFTYSLFFVLICSVVALKCDKLITNDDTATADHVFNEGIFHVKTTLQPRSGEIRELLNSLKDIDDVKLRRQSFTATLKPKHIKKLCRDDRIIHIKQVERIKYEIKCDKLLKGNSSHTVQDSYIIVTNNHILSAASLNLIEIASESIDSSVMIASSTPLHGSQNGFIMKMNDAAVEYVCGLPLVDYIEADQEIGIASTTTQWHLDRIDQETLPLDNQYSGRNGGSGVDIYIFDTGINYNHTEFDINRAKYSGLDPVDIVQNQNQNGLDCQGHGTHVAGLAGGKTYGVAKEATLYSVRVLDCHGYGSTATILMGLNHVIDQVRQKQASSKKTRAIINMSLTTRSSYISRSMRTAITKAVDNGILVVAAAGNYRSDACRYSPSSFTNVLTVGGTQRTDELYNTFFYGTNYGSCVDIFAPAQRIQSAYYTGVDSYAVLDGTSQATPLVSGAAAVYWNTLSDSADAGEVKDTLLSTCSKGQLNIAASVPSPFNQQTTNCLLHLQNMPPLQKVHHNVNFDEIETMINEMEQQNYALSYAQNYQSSENSTRYSFVFTNMKNKKFRTLTFITEKNVKEVEDQLGPKGFKIIFIHDLTLTNGLKRFVVVLARKTKYEYTAKLRVKPENLQQVQDRTDHMTLYSTSVISNTEEDAIFQTLLFSNETKVDTLFDYDVKKVGLFRRVSGQLKNGYHLKYLSSYMKNGREKYAVVFHKFTKPVEQYGVMYNIKPQELEVKISQLIAQGNTVNVVAGIRRPKFDIVQYLIAYEST